MEVWPADGEPQRFNTLQLLEAGAPFQGLQLQMEEIWTARTSPAGHRGGAGTADDQQLLPDDALFACLAIGLLGP